ncbi:hypothetical protein PV11_07459 [Exophiala sideris]|uniref:Uncharacterized protein n=1 Tax=Exophiala sideris TaxID=1016849 RepID=A0A0D1VUQ6_9EURO|nr:hypothetical protein PV11_07459 [Exophiala sideris]
MAPPPYRAEPGHWFLRGVQSAIFYYVACTPCLEYQHKRKRRQEAKAVQAANAEIVTTQPGIIRQPGPFQTNELWAEELMLGPGPPKGWKSDKLLENLRKKTSKEPQELSGVPLSPEMTKLQSHPAASPGRSTQQTPHSPATTTSSSSNLESATSETHSSNHDKPTTVPTRPRGAERSLSNAMENIKDSLRSTLHPEKWNWKRYDREDEILTGFGERVTRIWNRATSGTHHEGTEDPGPSYQRKRAATNETDRYDYSRARHPEVNDLHPPIVSQLPATREEVAWMLLPAPSAAVMAGKKRPGAETEMRRPLCVIGTPEKRPKLRMTESMTRSTQQVDEQDFCMSDAESVESIEVEDDIVHHQENSISTAGSSRIKHHSDPIIRPTPIHPRSSIAGDLFMPKRRDSWQFQQFHYVVPPTPNQTMC